MEVKLDNSLQGKKIAIVATNGFEQSELLVPRECLLKAGAEVDVIAPKAGHIQGMEHHEKGKTVSVDVTLGDADPSDYDALVLPGGVANPDALRINSQAEIIYLNGCSLQGKDAGARVIGIAR